MDPPPAPPAATGPQTKPAGSGVFGRIRQRGQVKEEFGGDAAVDEVAGVDPP